MGRWILLLALVLAALALPRWVLGWQFAGRIRPMALAPDRPVAIVFGAGLRRDGTPTRVLMDRVETAVELYRTGKVERLLMSGTARPGYDEPGAMARAAESLGVPAEAVIVDPQGFRTRESCARARAVFGFDSALLVSQRFHLTRALALCDSVGIDANGVAADRSRYSARSRTFWELREYPASLVAVLESLWDRQVFAGAA
jgi:SanA protein